MGRLSHIFLYRNSCTTGSEEIHFCLIFSISLPYHGRCKHPLLLLLLFNIFLLLFYSATSTYKIVSFLWYINTTYRKISPVVEKHPLKNIDRQHSTATTTFSMAKFVKKKILSLFGLSKILISKQQQQFAFFFVFVNFSDSILLSIVCLFSSLGRPNPYISYCYGIKSI